MQTPNLSILDMLSTAKARAVSKGTKPDGGFKDLFDEALGIAEKPAKKPEVSEQEPTEATPDDAVMSNAAATMAEAAPEVTPDNEPSPAKTGTGADSAAATVTTAAAAQQTAAATAKAETMASPLTAAPPRGDVISMELTGAAATAEAPAAAPLPGQIVTAQAENSKLGKMLGQAQQQLQQRTEPAEAAAPATPAAPTAPTAAPAAPVSELPAEPAPTAPATPAAPTAPATPPSSGIPTAPAGEAAAPPVTGEETTVSELPADTEAADEAAAEDTGAKPPVTPSKNPAAEVKVTEQRQLDAMPETDRAVMNMREQSDTRQRVEPVKPGETAAAAAAQQPAGPQGTQQAQNAQQAQNPQRQEAAPPDQAEQIRMQASENLKSGRTEFRMQLAPEELGKINVKLVMEGGRLAIEIVTSGARTAELLNRQAEALGMALRNHTGMDVTSVNVVSEAGNASGSMYSPFGMNSGTGGGAGQNHQNGRGSADNQDGDDPDLAGTEEDTEPETLLNRMI